MIKKINKTEQPKQKSVSKQKSDTKEMAPQKKKSKNALSAVNATQNEIIIPKDSLTFVSLGGITGIGLNCFLYGYEGKWLIVDCGMGFPGDHFPGVDILLPDPKFLSEHKKDIVGMVITHGHEDHIGAIPYLWQDIQCPIYATPFTAELIEDKLDEFGLLTRATVEVVPSGSSIHLPPFNIEFLTVSHSIPEPNMLIIRTKEGTIVHSGDWKFDNSELDANPLDEKQLEEVGKEGVLALVCDSTNIFTETSDKTEEDVRESLKELFKPYKQKIITTCFASNVTRLESIYEAAKACHRQVCLVGRSLWRIDDAARASGYLKDVPEFLTEDEAARLPSDKVVYILTGSQGEPYSALSKLASPKPMPGQLTLGSGDVIIFSSRVIPGNEMAISSLQKRLLMTGAQIITDKDALVHVSGHPAQDHMKRLYHYLKPQIAIPVHGEPLHIQEHKKLAEKWGAGIAMIIEEGDVLEINNGTPEILGEIPVGCLAVDGKKILSLSADVLKKRRKMIDAGSVVITAVVGKKGELLGTPQISSFGLLDEDITGKEDLFKRIEKQIKALKTADKQDDEKIKDCIRLVLRQFITEFYGKKPLLEVHLFRI